MYREVYTFLSLHCDSARQRHVRDVTSSAGVRDHKPEINVYLKTKSIYLETMFSALPFRRVLPGDHDEASWLDLPSKYLVVVAQNLVDSSRGAAAAAAPQQKPS
jgi:hypothetical protein